MARIPQYQRSVGLRPAFQQGLEVRGDPDAFGASVGRGLENLAQGVGDLGQVVQQAQAADDSNRAKDAENGFGGALRQLSYGEGGYFTSTGRAAVEGHEQWQKNVLKLQADYGRGLTGGAARAYQRASTARVTAAFDLAAAHQAQGRQQWSDQSSAARVSGFADDAVAAYQNSQLVTKNLGAGLAELAQHGQAMGWAPETILARQNDFISGVHKGVALNLAADDPLKAEAYVSANQARFSPTDLADVEGQIHSAALNERSKQLADGFLAGAPGPNGAGVAADTIRKFEGFNPNPQWDLNGRYSIGYGSPTVTNADGSVSDVKPGMRISEADAQRDLDRRISATQQAVIGQVGQDAWARLSPLARGAVTATAYFDGGLSDPLARAVATGDTAAIAEAIRTSGAGKGQQPGLGDPRHDAAADIALALGAPAAQQARTSFLDLQSYLAGIDDPALRDLTSQRINALLSARDEAAEATARQAKTQLWATIDQGGTPDDVPIAVRNAAGMDAVTSGWSYVGNRGKREAANGAASQALLLDLRLNAARQPDAFLKLDLNDYRTQLTPESLKELRGLQASTAANPAAARAKAPVLAAAMAQGTTALRQMGVTTEGLWGRQREIMTRRIAGFQNALYDQISAWSAANGGKLPGPEDVQKLLGPMLLPTALGASEAQADPDIAYSRIPPLLRAAVASELQVEQGRPPTEQEISHRYTQTLRLRP